MFARNALVASLFVVCLAGWGTGGGGLPTIGEDCEAAGEAVQYGPVGGWGCVTGLGAGGTVDDVASDSGTTTGANVSILGDATGIDTSVTGDILTIVFDGTEVTDNSLTAAALGVGSVDSSEIATDAVGTAELDLSITPAWTGDHDFSGAGIEIENGTTPPACTVGQIYLDTDATTGQQLMACEAGTFVAQGGAGSGTVTGLVGDSGGTTTGAVVTLAGGTNATTVRATDTVTIDVDDAFVVNSANDTMTGTLTADGLTLGANENITLGAQTLDHDGTDFVFNDDVGAPSFVATASATDGGSLTLDEDTDIGTDMWKVTVGQSNLANPGTSNDGSFTALTAGVATCKISTDGRLPDACVGDGVDGAATQCDLAISVASPGASEDSTVGFTNQAITISEIRAVLLGSSTPSVTWSLNHGTDRSSATVIDANTTTSVTTGDDITTITDATVPADSFVWLETSAQSGTVTELHVTACYTVD